MAKTPMTAVVDRIMHITECRIEAKGWCTLNECRREYNNVYGIQVGGDFVRNVWEQKGLEVVFDSGIGIWIAQNLPPIETDSNDTDAPDT